jgi:probable HAF family extracellular repeat protein
MTRLLKAQGLTVMIRALLSSLAFATALCASMSAAHAQTTYRLTVVSDGTSTTFVDGINDRGELALTTEPGGFPRAVLWRNGQTTDLGTLGTHPPFSESGGLNIRPQVVGTSISDQAGTYRAFLWSNGQISELPALPDSDVVFGVGINALGIITGDSYDKVGENESAIVWNRDRTISVLPPLTGDTDAAATAINIKGEVAGTSFTPVRGAVVTAVIWRHGVATIIATGATVTGLNDLSEVIGTIGSPFGSAYVWRNGALETLPPVGTGAAVAASGINDWGQIVGAVQSAPGGPGTAVLWDRSGGHDLNTLIAADDPLRPYITLTSGAVINNLGQIVANGSDSRSGTLSGKYLLTPVRTSQGSSN